MQNPFYRTQLLFGKAAIETLAQSRVAVFGVGGVGGYVVEVLARSGVGHIDLIDNDRVSITNLNRQILALTSTIGKYKVDIAEQRIKDINPQCVVHTYHLFYLPDNADEIDLSKFDYVVDCIDTVAAKLELIKRCDSLGVPLISCMGAANKIDPTAFRIADINDTIVDPLARVIRKKLRKLGIQNLKVVFSEEEPLKPLFEELIEEESNRRSIPASNAFVPPAAGLVTGGEVIKDLIRKAGTFREDASI